MGGNNNKKVIPAKSPLKRKVVEINLLDDDSESGERHDFGSFESDDEENAVPSSQQVDHIHKKRRIESDNEEEELDLPTYSVMNLAAAKNYMPSQSQRPLSPVNEDGDGGDDDDDDDVSFMSLRDRIAMRKTDKTNNTVGSSDSKKILLDLDFDDLSPF